MTQIMNMIEGMEKEGFEWDILNLQEVAMRSQGEEWKYEMNEFSGTQFW